MANNDLSALTFRAGSAARALIAREGLRPEFIKVIAGAAGGPKWLVLGHLDRFVFSEWLSGRTAPLFLVGSSIATWRFACAARQNPRAAFDRFQQDYIHQTYGPKPSAQEVTIESRKILDGFLDSAGIAEILNHPFLRLNVLAVRSRGMVATDQPLVLSAGLLASALGNLISRSSLAFFYQQTLFYNPRTPPPFFRQNGFPEAAVALSAKNLKPAILGSGSIPLVMTGVRDIPGANAGVYRDGGIVDYHLDIPFGIDSGLVQFPHFSERVIPGWFDKNLPWRKPGRENMRHVLLVAPSHDFLEKLPLRKIPDRGDFKLFSGRDKERFVYWEKVFSESERLAEAFQWVIENGIPPEQIQPL